MATDVELGANFVTVPAFKFRIPGGSDRHQLETAAPYGNIHPMLIERFSRCNQKAMFKGIFAKGAPVLKLKLLDIALIGDDAFCNWCVKRKTDCGAASCVGSETPTRPTTLRFQGSHCWGPRPIANHVAPMYWGLLLRQRSQRHLMSMYAANSD